MIRTTVVAKVRPEKRKEFLQAISSLQGDRERGNLRGVLRLYEDEEDRTVYRLIDEWETDGDLEGYRGDEGFRVLLGALKTLCVEAQVKYSVFCQERGEPTAIISQHIESWAEGDTI